MWNAIAKIASKHDNEINIKNLFFAHYFIDWFQMVSIANTQRNEEQRQNRRKHETINNKIRWWLFV